MSKEIFGYLESINEINEKKEASEFDFLSFLEFRLVNEPCFLRLEDVKEVIKYPTFNKVALTKNWFLGLSHIKSDVYSGVNFDGFISNKNINKTTRFAIVLASDIGSYALGVNDIIGIHKLRNDNTSFVEDGFFDIVNGNDGGLLKVLSLKRLIMDPEFNNISIF